MALKPRTRRKIFLTALVVTVALAVALVLVPPMFTLNRLKPKMEAAIAAQTGVEAKINGDVHFSLLGRVTIVAQNISVPDGKIGAAAFSVPIGSLFDLSRATLDDRIGIYDADVNIQRLGPATTRHDIELHNCRVMFLGKEYRIIDGMVGDGVFRATVRTDQHKYDVRLNGDEFYVTNKNNDLVISGYLNANGGARGTMALRTANMNKMFEFSEPKIPGPVTLDMKFDWDGGYGVKFSDIIADNFTGNIDIAPDGRRDIEIKSSDLTFDFSFLLEPTKIIYETSFDLNLRGRLTLGDMVFSRLIIRADGAPGALHIDKIVADDTVISGGEISADGARDMMISTKIDGQTATCLFSGTPRKWSCKKFAYRDISGEISVDGDMFSINVSSARAMPSDQEILEMISHLGRRGTIKFIFSDAAGTMHIDGKKIRPEFKFARDKTLDWMRGASQIMPEFMHNEIGDFSLNGDRVTFRPHSGRWELTTQGDAFVISGRSMHDWFPHMDLTAIADGEYFVSGLRRGDTISNLTIRMLGHEFTGTASGRNITLKTDTLDLDTFINQAFTDNYDEMEFLTDAPIMLPFGLGVNISIDADSLIYNGDEYKNFIYSLKNGTQTYSITDKDRGNMLAIITKENKNYDISVQVSKFKTSGPLLAATMPLNLYDATITGEAEMHTGGQIAHDIEYNLTGTGDFTMTGGYITGIGIDEFYARAETLKTLDAEYAIADALEQGQTRLKEMHIAGEFAGGDFHTTEPVTVTMRHAEATGNIEIKDEQMTADLQVVMRATSPSPSKIALRLEPDGTRRYSLSEIMTNFDAGFMRQFIKTHDRF